MPSFFCNCAACLEALHSYTWQKEERRFLSFSRAASPGRRQQMEFIFSTCRPDRLAGRWALSALPILAFLIPGASLASICHLYDLTLLWRET